MRVNADFSQRVVVTPANYAWVPSPQSGVERVMLDRIGAEQARATSIVRYAASADFPAHSHPGGEEILVLSGTFSDDAQDFPQGWYLRNPPGSAHRPSSLEGATIFVKLMQMPVTQRTAVHVDTRDAANWQTAGSGSVCPLFADAHERVELLRVPADVPLSGDLPGQGRWIVELLVLAGTLCVDGTPYPSGSWVRLPGSDTATITAGADGVTVYRKTYTPPETHTKMPS